MATTTEIAPTKLILPSIEEAAAPSNMPPAKVLAKWQDFVDRKQRFKLRDSKAAHIVGSDAARVCDYGVDHLFPEHDTVKNTVRYCYIVVMLIEWPKEMKSQPLPTFKMYVDDFEKNFAPV